MPWLVSYFEVWTFLPWFEQWIGVAWDIIIFSILTSSMFDFFTLKFSHYILGLMGSTYSSEIQKSIFLRAHQLAPEYVENIFLVPQKEKLTQYWSALDFWKIKFEKSCWPNLNFLSISKLTFAGHTGSKIGGIKSWTSLQTIYGIVFTNHIGYQLCS